MFKKWTKEDIKKLKTLVKLKSNKEIALVFRVSRGSIESILRHNKITRTEAVKKIIYSKAMKKWFEKNSFKEENNPNWRGGISKNNYHYKKLQIERYPEKIHARVIVHRAIRNGSLIKKPCEICSEKKVEGHHEDYNKPLEVNWLCKKHHLKRHREMNKNQLPPPTKGELK